MEGHITINKDTIYCFNAFRSTTIFGMFCYLCMSPVGLVHLLYKA